MYTHAPSSLRGPVTSTHPCWTKPIKTKPSLPAGSKQLVEPPFRADLVERIRREIAEGTYETPEKWEAALERLQEHLEEE